MIIHTFETREGLIDVGSLKVSLNRILATASDKLQAEFVPITGELKQYIMKSIHDSELKCTETDVVFAIGNKIYEHLDIIDTDDKVLLSISEGSVMSKLCQKLHKPSKRGLFLNFIVFDYAPDYCRLSNQIHECLHLFGVKECYNEETLKPKESCTNEKCLMRYGVTSKEVCGEVICQLKKFAEEHFA